MPRCIIVPVGRPGNIRRIGAEGEFFGSLACKSGQVVAIAAGDKFQLLRTNPLNELCQSTPAISGGRMYVRTWSQLHCVGPK